MTNFVFSVVELFGDHFLYETLNTGVLSVVRVGRFNMYTGIFNIYIYIYLYGSYLHVSAF